MDKNKTIPPLSQTTVMRSAFYTPTIDEFHVGFEFEFLNNKEKIFFVTEEGNKWLKTEMPFIGVLSELKNIRKLILDKQVRVKHIDKDDCISLGLKLKVWDNGSGYFEIGNYTIGIYGTDLFCTVSQNDYGNNIIRFSGDLKNKTELKRILRQVGCLAS